MNAVATVNDPGALIESVIVKGDLERLTPEQRTQYYVRVCESVGLNPLTKPFEYIKLNGKLVLYARKDATDQLRKMGNISVTEMTEVEREGVHVVTVKVRDAQGRTDMASGAVTITSLKGDALANALMKAETKAKRRATLSICGLGFLDETEIETIPTADNGNGKRKSSAQANRDGDWPKFMADVFDCETAVRLEALRREYRTNVYPTWNKDWQDQAEAAFDDRQAELTAGDLKQTLEDSVAQETVDEDGVITTPNKGDFIRHCFDIIEAARDKTLLLNWFNSKDQKAERRRHGMNVGEAETMMDRIRERIRDLDMTTHEA